jgi:hypothetical protein
MRRYWTNVCQSCAIKPRQVMVSWLAELGLSRSWRRKRAATCPGNRRAAASKKCALEKTAPLSVKVIEELLLMEFKVRTSPVISSAHGRTSLFDVPEVPFLTILLTQVRVFARCGKELVGQLRGQLC